MSDKKTFEVTIPIAGHAFVQVEAESEEEAKQKAMEEVDGTSEIHWEPLEQFNSGNVCHCPSPWEIDVMES